MSSSFQLTISWTDLPVVPAVTRYRHYRLRRIMANAAVHQVYRQQCCRRTVRVRCTRALRVAALAKLSSTVRGLQHFQSQSAAGLALPSTLAAAPSLACRQYLPYSLAQPSLGDD